MLLGKKRKPGRKIGEMNIGEKLTLTEKIEDKDLLLYLGLTNDSNPLYIQHDYASQTPFKKPIVPSIMLTGIVTAAVSKYLPGPGSSINEQQIKFIKPVYHYATIKFLFEITKVDVKNNEITMYIEAVDEDQEVVLNGTLKIAPPLLVETFTGSALENF
jgi:3-hydroxybutyryl-CoA dehydratase